MTNMILYRTVRPLRHHVKHRIQSLAVLRYVHDVRVHAGCFSKYVPVLNLQQLSYKEILNVGTVSDSLDVTGLCYNVNRPSEMDVPKLYNY